MSAVDGALSAPGAQAREATLRSFNRPGRGYWLLLIALAAVVELGVVAWSVQLRHGMGVSGFNDHAFWAIDLANVVTFIGVSYGGAVVSAILRLTGATWRAPLSRLAEGTAVVTVLIGGAFIVPHLGRPDRIWELVARPNLSSPIFWDFVAISTYTIASIVFFALPLIPDLAILRRESPGRLGVRARLYGSVSRGWVGAPRQRAALSSAVGLIAILIIPLAVSVHSVLSWAFSLTSRPWWHESIWAPYFVVAALYSGVALVILVVAGFRRAYHLEELITERHFIRLGYILAVFASAYLYLTFADILPSAYVGEPSSAAVLHELLLGHFAPWFWTFVAAGGLFPILVIAFPRTRTVPGVVVAAAVVVPVMWLKRLIMVAAPSTFDTITHTFGAYHFTWIPVSITLAGAAAVPLLLMLLFRVVPLLSIDEIEELALESHLAEPYAGPPVVDSPPPPVRRAPQRVLARDAGIAVLLLIAVVGAILVIGAKPARAETSASPQAAAIVVRGSEDATGLHLLARLTDATGAPVPRVELRFWQWTDEFGPKGQLVPLGSGLTRADGVARFTYRPALAGMQRYEVTYAGGPFVGPAKASTKVAVTSALSPYRPAPPKPLSGLGKGLVAALFVIVQLVLATLIIQVARVVRACRAGV